MDSFEGNFLNLESHIMITSSEFNAAVQIIINDYFNNITPKSESDLQKLQEKSIILFFQAYKIENNIITRWNNIEEII